MPEKELTLEEFRKLQESLGQEPIPGSPQEVTRAIGKRTAEATTPIPSPSAALGRENILGDIFNLGGAVQQTLFNPLETFRGFPTLRESVKSAATPQRKPSLEFLKGSDIGRILPDIAQAGTVEVGQRIGAIGGVPGAVAGSVAGSLAGNALANKMQEVSPELFGEDLGTVKIGGVEIPTEEFNLMMDAGIPLMSGLPRLTMQGLKNQTARALVKLAGEEAPEEVAKAYQHLTNPANEIDISQIPQTTTAAFGGPLEGVEQIASIRGKQKVRNANALKQIEFLKTQGGLSDAELKDIAVTRDLAEQVNVSPLRKESISIPTNRIPLDPSTARGVDILARAGKVFNNLKSAADARFNFVRDTLAIQGDTTIPLHEGVVSNLLDIHKGLEDIIESTPELAKYYAGPKSTIENLLNLPKTTKSVSQKGDKIVTLEKTVETPKKTKITTGETKQFATPEGRTKEFFSETVGAEEGNLLSRTTGVQKTTNIPGATEEPILTTAIDYNSLLTLNSQLKRSISRGSVINPREIPVVQTIDEIEKAIQDGLRSKPNGVTLLKKHTEGSNLTNYRYKTFNDKVENILAGTPQDIWPKIFKDPNVANAFVAATGSRETAKKEIFANLIENSFDKSGQFDPRKALNTLNDSPGVNELLTAKQKNNIKQFLTFSSGVTQDISDIGKFSVAMRSGNLAVSVGAPLATLSGFPAAAAGAATLWFGGRHVLSKILLDPEAAKIATGLVKMPANSPRALGEVRKLFRYLNGEKVVVNMGNQSFETEIDSDILSRLKFANRQTPNQTYDLLERVRQVAPSQ